MYEIMERVHTEIKEVLGTELNPRSVEVLGELVDIVKDIKYIEYLECKMARYNKEGTYKTGTSMIDFMNDFRDYELKRTDYIKTKDATKKEAMQSSLSAMISKYRDTLKEMWDLFTLEEEKEIIRNVS